MDGGGGLSRADSTRRQTPTFQRPLSRPVSSRAFAGAAPKPAGGGAVKSRPISYDYATGSTFSVKINGKPVFLLNDFRKKVDGNVKNARYVSAFKKALEQQVHDKKKQDAIRDQYDKAIVPRFAPVEHTDTGLTKRMLGLDPGPDVDEDPPEQGKIGYSRIDRIEAWENSSGGGLEKYNPCVTSVFAPVQYQGLDDSHPQWQREPSSFLSPDFVYGYQGASCWDKDLFGEGPGMDNVHFIQGYDNEIGKMRHTGEILYFTAACAVVYNVAQNKQRFLFHSDDVTACALLKRVVQKPDGSWEESTTPGSSAAKEQWAQFFAYNRGVYTPNEQPWSPMTRLLPQSSEQFPQFDDGIPMDWRDWDLPNRCIVATGQKGRYPRIFVWRIIRDNGESNFESQVLATMSLGKNRLMVQSLSFNSRGNYLISMANDFHHTVCVFDWKNKSGPQKIREGQAHSGLCDTAKFNPYSDSAFASCGEKHVKFWEIGDSELEMAVGLFGDIGSPLDQRTVVFNPRGNAISGVRNGDIYVWASGNVQAKFEAAHKENVIGLLFVDGIGLFSCGTQGYLKMWDPDLKDTRQPLCVVDLKAFCLKGEPRLTAQVAGRAMDWTTSLDILTCVWDTNPVEDNPAYGVRGAPATHMSLRDMGATGCLMVGMTDNSVLFLGFRKNEGDWTKGLSGDHMVQGDSVNTEEAPLKAQRWWDDERVTKVRENAAKYGCKKGNLPVAVYWYQKYEETKPGYMPGGQNSRGCPWTWAVCGKRVAMRGHMAEVDSVVAMPDERIFMSMCKDGIIRFFDINDQSLIDCCYVHKPVRSGAFWSQKGKNGATGTEMVNMEHCSVFATGHEDGSFAIWHTEKTAAAAADQNDADDKDPFFDPENAFGNINMLCCNPLPRPAAPVGQGRKPSEQAFSVKYTPNGKYFAVALGDNCIDLYKHEIRLMEREPVRTVMKEKAKQKALGFSDEEIERQKALPYQRVGCCNDHSSAVTHIDFDEETLYMRSTSQSNELLYAFLPSGKQAMKTEELSVKKWTTHNCVLGWSVKSIWQKGSNGNDVNTIDRSCCKVPPWAPCHGGNRPSPYPYSEGVTPGGSTEPVDQYKTRNFPGEGKSASWGHHVCATGDDFGKIKLFRWPAFGFKQAFRAYIGHGSHVMSVRFSYDDDYLVSAGGNDMSVFQWRHVIPNKVYIQNLPDEVDENGEYKCHNHELKAYLENFLSRFLKVRKGLRKDDANLNEKLKKARQYIGQHQTKPEEQRIKRMVYAHQEAWPGLSEDEEKLVKDRDIVSINIFSTGAAWEGKYFPSQKDGCKISKRWACVVFRTKDDVDDVMELHGAMEILSYTKFFEDGLLHLHPLYIESEQEAADSDKGKKYDRKNPQINTRRTTEKDPATGEKIIKSWQPLEDGKTNLPQYSSDTKNGGLPHFLCITSYDPSESPTSRILHKAMYNISEKMKDEMHENVTWPTIKKLWAAQEKESSEVTKWTTSDDKYGLTCLDEAEFADFFMWKAEQDKKLSGGKDKGAH